MPEKIERGILKYKGAILLGIAILFVVAIVGTVFLVRSENKINSDMVSYLRDDSDTKRGLVFLQDEFGIRGNATLVVRVDENDEQDVASFKRAVSNVEKIAGVSSVTWYGSVQSYEGIETSLSDLLGVLSTHKAELTDIINRVKEQHLYAQADDLLSLISLADLAGTEFVDTTSMESYLRHETKESGVYDYVLLVLTDIDAGDAAYALLDDIKAEFSYTAYASSGTTETAKTLLTETMADLPWFILVGVLSVLIILLLASSSFIEPFILLSTLIVGIIVSMGMNYLFPSISIISFAISAVLQLAITMDYAIFFMHIYRKKRRELDPTEASVKAFPEVAESILASGFTTVGGFAALYCMQFKIGTDIANVLIKGVVLSMVTVLILQPILTIFLDKIILKTTHNFTEKLTAKLNAKRDGKKPLSFDKESLSRPIAKFSVWQRIVLIVLAVGLIVPSFLAQRKVQYSYLELYEKKVETEEEIFANELGNQLILSVPLLVSKKNATQKDFVTAVKSVNEKRITGMLGVFTAIDLDENILRALLDVAMSESSENMDIRSLKTYLTDPQYASIRSQYGITDEDVPILSELLDAVIGFDKNVDGDILKSFFKKVNGEWYTVYTVSFSGNTEDSEAQKAYGDIISLCSTYFGANRYYPVGMITSSYEMAAITPKDFLVVTLVSIAIIYLIVTVLLRNPLKSLFIVLIIELGIWINLALSYLLGQSINFVVYIIISSVQLGCTVDYAILFANTFEKNRPLFDSGKKCAIETAATTTAPILTSALMIGSVCLGMYLISGNLVIRQLTGMLARGALISFLLVVFVQTAVWSFFKTARKDKHFEEKLQKLEESANASPAPTSSVQNSNDVSANEKKGKVKKKKLTIEEKLALLEEEEKKNK